MPLIDTQNCKTAVEFLEKLSPIHEHWRNTGGQFLWWFRGQSDATWELLPSAMRAGTRWSLGTIGTLHSVPAKTLQEQLDYEHTAFLDFVKRCKDCALPIPEDGQWFRSPGIVEKLLPSPELNDGIDFPFALHRSVYALAQHHGVPTRLLDWSTNPMVAAYFAVKDVAKHAALQAQAERRAAESDHKAAAIAAEDPGRPSASAPPPPAWTGDHCVVIALRTPLAFDRLGREAQKSDPYLEEVSAPYEHNPRLRAQRGMFTLLVDRKKPAQFRQPSLEQLIRRLPRSEEEESQSLLLKLTLPHTESRRALRLLAQANMHAGFVFPEYDGVVEAGREIGYHE